MIRFVDSFAHMTSADVLKKWTNIYPGDGAQSILATSGRCSDPCLQLTSTAILYKGIQKHASAGVKRGFVGFAYKNVSMLGGTSFFSVGNGSSPEFSLTLTDDGAIHVKDEDSVDQTVSAPAVMNSNGWYYVEVGWTQDAAASRITVKVNGITVINNVLVDFTVTLHPTLDNEWTYFALECSANATNYFGHVYCCDDYDDTLLPATNTFLGDVRVQYLRPTTNGAHTDWTVSGGGSHANAVDKDAASDGTTPKITSSTVSNVDTNIYEDPVYTSGTCYGVQFNILCEKDAAGPRTIAPVVLQGGVPASGVAQAPSLGTKEYKIQMFDRNPITGVAWSYSEVAGDQYGVEVAG
jgi:hypothetical protein